MAGTLDAQPLTSSWANAVFLCQQVPGGELAEKPAFGRACRRKLPDVVAEQDVVLEPDVVTGQDE